MQPSAPTAEAVATLSCTCDMCDPCWGQDAGAAMPKTNCVSVQQSSAYPSLVTGPAAYSLLPLDVKGNRPISMAVLASMLLPHLAVQELLTCCVYSLLP